MKERKKLPTWFQAHMHPLNTISSKAVLILNFWHVRNAERVLHSKSLRQMGSQEYMLQLQYPLLWHTILELSYVHKKCNNICKLIIVWTSDCAFYSMSDCSILTFQCLGNHTVHANHYASNIKSFPSLSEHSACVPIFL